MSKDPVLAERLARQGLGAQRTDDLAAAVAQSGGLQAQDAAQARLGLRSRTRGASEQAVLDAIAGRTLVRTWLMRNTVHLVAAADLRWMTGLLGPMIRRRFETVRWPALGLTPRLLERAAAAAPAVLAGRELARHAFAAALRDHGVPVPDAGQASTHLLVYLSTVGLVCRSTDRGRESRFALVDEWLPDRVDGPHGDDALAELARRFLRAFSPAVAADFTTWSGLPSGRAIELIRDELTPVDVHGRPGYRLGEVEPSSGVTLLAGYDNYLLAHRDRAPIIDAARVPEVYVGGVIRPTLLVDGRVAGRWRLVRTKGSATVELTPFAELTRRVRAAVEAEVADIGRFLAAPVALTQR